MAKSRATSKPRKSAEVRALARPDAKTSAARAEPTKKKSTWSDLFATAACATAHWTGKPLAFLIATGLVIVWALTGPMFGYSDTWQLVINTSTTIVTFLMVFLIQNTQNRDTMALQLKLSELILAMNEAENRFAKAEDLSEEELEELHKELSKRAETTLDRLTERRSATKKAS